MKIVLIKDVEKLGKAFEIKQVARGYAFNYLLKRNLAVPATKKAVAMAKAQVKRREAKKLKVKTAVQKTAQDLKKAAISLTAKATEKGALFESITKAKIAKEIVKVTKLTKLDAKSVQLAKPIKKVGNYKVKVKLGPDLATEVKVKVTGVTTGKGKLQKAKSKRRSKK
jgi:large subunit ribosomal protein L9